MLSVRNCRQPSSVVATTVGRFVDRKEECLFSATLAKVMVWCFNTDGSPEDPLYLFGSWPMFSGITGCANIHGQQDDLDSILLITRCFSWSIVRWDDDKKAFEKLLVHINGSLEKVMAQGRLQNPSHGVYFPLPDGVRICQRAGPKEDEELVLVCCWNTIFHLFTLRWIRGDTHLWIRTTGSTSDYSLAKGIPGPMTRLISWSFLLPPNDTDFEDCPLIAILFEDEKGLVDLETSSIKYEDGDKLQFNLLQGPWCFSTVHAGTNMVLACGAQLSGGCVVVSSASIIAVGDQGLRGELPVTKRFVTVSPLASQTNAATNRKNRSLHWILGSNDGQVHLLSIFGDSKSAKVSIHLKPIKTDILLSNAWATTILRSQDRILQLWCTKTGHTSILDVTELSQNAERASQSDEEAPVADVLCSPFEESLGSITDAIAVDYLGDGEMQLLLACGQGSDTCLRLCRSGLEVSKIIEEGPEMLECSDLFALRGLHLLHHQPQDVASNHQRLRPFDSHLVFSFAAINQTKVLELNGHEFAPVNIPGLCEDANTVFVASLPLGHLLQVTMMEIRLINMRKSLSNSNEEECLQIWSPRVGSINMASAVKYENATARSDANDLGSASLLSSLVVAVDSVLNLFEISSQSSKSDIRLWHSRHFEHQISAIHMLKAQDKDVKIIVAQWVSNTIQIVQGRSLQTVFVTSAFPVHLRSVYLWKLPHKLSYQQDCDTKLCDHVAVVGSSTGTVHIFPVPSLTSRSSNVETMQEICKLRVGETAVNISAEETEETVHGIHLHSNYDAWLSVQSGSLEVKRINGIEKAKAVCNLHTEFMPRSLVWINDKDCLQFGKLAEDRRTSTIYQKEVKLAENVVSMTHSRRHHCALVLTESPRDSQSKLRIFSDDSLQEIWCMQLMQGHVWSCIAASRRQAISEQALCPDAAAIDCEIFATVSYVETNDRNSSASCYLQDKEHDQATEDETDEFSRGQRAVIAVWEIESVTSKPQEDQDPDVTFDVRLIGIREVSKVFTHLQATEKFGVFIASAASELYVIKCSPLDERDAASSDRDAQGQGRRFARIGELHLKLKIDILPKEPDLHIEHNNRGLVHDGAYADGYLCALRWLQEMEFVEVQWNTSTELFNIVASLQPDREGLHEIVSCELFDKSRGVVGDALGNLLIFERIGDRIAALFCMNARSGGITRIMTGRLGLHFLNQPADTHPPFIFVTTDGAIGTVSTIPSAISEEVSRLHALLQTLLPPFSGAWHKNVFPRRNAEVVNIGEVLSAGRDAKGLIDADFLHLMLRCEDDEVWKTLRARMKKEDEHIKDLIARVNNILM